MLLLLSKLFGLPTGFANTQRIGNNIRLLFRRRVVYIVAVHIHVVVGHILLVVVAAGDSHFVVGRLIGFAINFVVTPLRPAMVIAFVLVIVITIFICVRHVVVGVAVAAVAATVAVAVAVADVAVAML